MGKRINNSKNNNKITIIVMIVMLVIFSLTISYAAFSDQFTITNIISHVRVYKVVRINGVTTNSGAVTDLDYNTNSILNTVYIPAGSSVTYSVTATNLGNVPVAVSDVSFTNGNGTVNNLSSNVSTKNYIKICDNNVCTNGVSRTFDIIITNTGNTIINSNLEVNLTFSEVYTISYEGNQIGETIDGTNFTYTFSSNAPAKLAKTSGTCGSFNYTNSTLNVTNVGSDLNFAEAHTITYNGDAQGYVADGGTYTYTFESQWPANVTKTSGTSGTVAYNFATHTITIPNVTSDIVLTGTIGTVAITRIDHVTGSDKNVLSSTPPTFSGMNASFSVVFQRPEGSTETAFETMYEVEIENTHYNDYIFRGLDFNPQITAEADSDTAELSLIPIGITEGETIASGDTKTFQVKLVLTTNNPDGSYGTSTSTQVDTTPDTEEETGTITATINTTNGNLQSPNVYAPFTVSVTSTYPSDKEFHLILTNSNLELTADTNGTSLGALTIHGESTETYNVYIKAIQDAQFVNNSTTTAMNLSSEGLANVNVDTITLVVDKYAVPDTTKVTVSNLQLNYYYDTANSRPTIKATWDRDDHGGTAITNYVVTAYTTDGTQRATCETANNPSGPATRECLLVGLSENTNYYAVVYGIDGGPNSGASDVATAIANPGVAGYATRTATNSSWTWTYTVNTSGLRNLTPSTTTAIRGSTYTATISAGSWPNNEVPSDLGVTMVGTSNLSNGNGYDYTTNNTSQATLKVYNVTGDISLSGSASCLVEGTKVLLADGNYKNIEDIDYDDLLLVHNYETGTLVKEYPIWIEKDKRTIAYQKNTFSDGTILKTVGWHGLFSPELNRFITVDNPSEFHIGTKVSKLNKTKTGYDTVTVTNIEYITEAVNYYHVVSTRYYNIIANDFLTTDGTTVLSNLYGFDKNITWPTSIRNMAMQDMYTYDDLKDAIPYYMYKGLRAEEGKFLANYGLDLNTFKYYLINNQNNPNMLKLPINNLGRNLWMVTTSEDNVNKLNKHNYLHHEGSIYILPQVNNSKFLYWYNTADNKIYYPGDRITVYHGIHFEAIYK